MSKHIRILLLLMPLFLTACKPEATEAAAVKPLYFNCGEMGVKTLFGQDSMVIGWNGQDYELPLVVSASGAKFETPQDMTPHILFWNKGDEALLEIGGQAYPVCKQVVWQSGDITHYRAHGNEPFWNVNFDAGHIRLSILDGGEHVISRPAAAITENARSYKLDQVDGKITIMQAPENAPCTDGMSSRYYPDHVTLDWQDRHFEGCGGATEPASFSAATGVLSNIIDKKLEVVSIDGSPVIVEFPLTLTFMDNGRLGGHAHCNRYSGSYTVTGEILTIGKDMAMTMMACADRTLMQKEQHFTSLLSAMTRAEMTDDGGVLLSNGSGRTIGLEFRP